MKRREEEAEGTNEQLLKGLAQVLVQQLKALFPSLSAEAVEKLLKQTNGDVLQAVEQLLPDDQQVFSGDADEDEKVNMTERRSVVQFYSGEYGGKCGYCKKSKTGRISWGADAPSLRVEDYQTLIDRGWRRSGTWIYKPTNDKACCPQYTIRLDVEKFRPSASQKSVLKNLQKFLQDGSKDEKKAKEEENEERENEMEGKGKGKEKEREEKKLKVEDGEEETEDRKQMIKRLVERGIDKLLTMAKDHTEQQSEEVEAVLTKVVKECKLGASASSVVGEWFDVTENKNEAKKKRGDFSTNVALKLVGVAQHLKEEEEKTKKNADIMEEPHEEGKEQRKKKRQTITPQLAGMTATQLASMVKDGILKVKEEETEEEANHLRLARVVTSGPFVNFFFAAEEKATHNEEAEVKYEKKETVWRKRKRSEAGVGAMQEEKGENKGGQQDINAHNLQITMRKAKFTDEMFEVYKKYQMSVHNDPASKITPSGFTRFLCDNPLFADDEPTDDEEHPWTEWQGFGAFHQLYRLDGKLIAVGVVDILPRCLSSVYFFYDPDYAFLSPGVLSALKEIAWIQNVVGHHSARAPSLKYYYMGYYIHSCPKMRYKAAYRPSDLLCPIAHKWVTYKDCVSLLDVAKYTRLAPPAEEEAPERKILHLSSSEREEQARRIPFLYKNQLYTYEAFGGELKRLAMEWMDLVGPDLASSIIISI